MELQHLVDAYNWDELRATIDAQGFVQLPSLLKPEQCQQIIGYYDRPFGFRKTVVMQTKGYGEGEYKYFDYPLPPLVSELRQSIYSHLAPLANEWMRVLNVKQTYPASLDEFLRTCHKIGQDQATPLLLRYDSGGFNAMHQDLYGTIYFPLQMVIALSQVDEDYSGGDFVLSEQAARSQARTHIQRLEQGTALIFASSFRPVRAKDGFKKATVKHGVSTILSGRRYTAGIIFHDAER